MSKNLRLAVALIVGIPLLALLALYLLVDPQKLSPILVAQLSKALNRNASIEKLDFKIFPPSFKASNLVVADDPAFSAKPFLKAETLEIRPAILPLLSGQIELQSVRILEPQLELIQNEKGVWNFDSIGASSKSNEPNSLSLNQLLIERANLGIKQPDSPRDLYSNLSAELRNYAEGKPFGLKVSAQMPSGKSIEAEGTITSASGKTTFSQFTLALASLKASVNGEVSAGALNLELKIPKSPIADAAPLFLPSAMTVKGDVIAGIKITGTPKEPVLNGRLDIAGFEVSGGDIKQPVKTAKLSLVLTPERIMLEPANISSGSTQLQAFGVIAHYDKAPRLEATLIAPDAQVAELLAIARVYGMSSVEGLSATGQAKLQVRASGLLEAKTPLAFSGTGSLRNASFQSPSLTKPVEITSTDFRFESNSASLSAIQAKLASSNLQGDCKVSNFKNPVVEFNLTADKILLDEIRSLVKDSQSKNDSPAKLTASGSVKIGTLQLAELTLTQLTAQSSYRDGHLVLAPLNASLYGGRHSGSMDIDLRPAKPIYSMNSKLEKIESSQFLAAATSLKGIVSGPFSADLQINFSPADPVQIAQSLNGKISLNFAQGRIASFNLTNELSALAKFLGFNPATEKFTQFMGLTGDLEITGGKASTQNLKIDLANLTAGLTGNMNLADQTLDLKLLSVLDKRFSDQVGGNKIGGFMTAAFANPNGNLMIPASIKGTFAKPIMAPDPGAIAKMKLQSFNPKDPKQMMDSVNSVFDMFKKKKPQ